ncbi:hypothetical protein FH608_010905 [Nonomuraea phyllanthi]|uniref:Uncharacterized protein n=1 Tax=Nonomuraea phyllanthi TaxID=2219224 RepID=A0A5C4WQS4_9ACTN|nr:hypothetical protein [Nonomuraea phyllanthi]KAB8195975.1 hypothetical protein FH608_010905 [Nonomuraea phyllanthi]QFY07429.1 hypothetical protein GBF35_12705 [Nonomuraea phyllanthi]
MLYLFGFERIGVAVSDIYFVDPNPEAGQEGAERGVRLELRRLEPGELKGSIYSARPITVDRPLWRVDLLESVTGTPGSFDRTHHHPSLHGWEPGRRVFDKELSGEPLKWLGERLADLEGVLDAAGVSRDEVSPADVAGLRERAPEIVDTVSRLLGDVRSGTLATVPGDAEGADSVRASWL